jgi:hypothetical protein
MFERSQVLNENNSNNHHSNNNRSNECPIEQMAPHQRNTDRQMGWSWHLMAKFGIKDEELSSCLSLGHSFLWSQITKLFSGNLQF